MLQVLLTRIAQVYIATYRSSALNDHSSEKQVRTIANVTQLTPGDV